MATPSAVVAAPKKNGGGLVAWVTGLPKFFREVRAEARKITWTSRQETWITSVMVAIMVVLAALFFFVVNWLCNLGVTTLIKLATGG